MSIRYRSLVWAAALLLPGLAGIKEARAQLFFSAEAVFMDRNNEGGSPIIGGPEAVSLGDQSYGAEPGYRLRLGGFFEGWQFDTSFTQIEPWTTSSSGVFANPVVFDDEAGNPLVADPANTLLFAGGLRSAALSSLAGADESTEGELLLAGSTYALESRSNYRDFELNFGTNENCSRWRFAAGYRHIRLDESSGFSMLGLFNAIDSATGFVPGDAGNVGNDGLSHNALDDAGFGLISGGADGYDAELSPDGADTLQYTINGSTYNELNGAQFVIGYRMLDGAWLTIDALGKAGIYRNNVSGRLVETIVGSGNDNSVYRQGFADDDISAAFAGNVGLRGIVSLTDYINVTGGYEVLFLSGVALSDDQPSGLRRSSTGTTIYAVNTNGALIAHGGTVGLEFLW